jgi:hypothetical protein
MERAKYPYRHADDIVILMRSGCSEVDERNNSAAMIAAVNAEQVLDVTRCSGGARGSAGASLRFRGWDVAGAPCAFAAYLALAALAGRMGNDSLKSAYAVLLVAAAFAYISEDGEAADGEGNTEVVDVPAVLGRPTSVCSARPYWTNLRQARRVTRYRRTARRKAAESG